MFEIDFSTSERSHTDSQPQGTKSLALQKSWQQRQTRLDWVLLIETEVPVPRASIQL